MSYILEALKKSEKERQIGQVPTLHSVETGELTPASKIFPILLVAIIVLLLVVVALLYFQTGKVETEMPMESEAEREESSVAQITEPMDIMDVMAQEQERKQQLQAKNKDVAPVPIKTEVISEQSNEVLLKEGEILITPTSRREVAETKEKEVMTITDNKSVPLLSETEYDFQTQLPDMNIDVHVYKDRRKDRFVLINMDKYREGQKMSSGIIIEAIVVDGVMMSYQGRRFLLSLN